MERSCVRQHVCGNRVCGNRHDRRQVEESNRRSPANSHHQQQQGPFHANPHQTNTDGTTYYGHHRVFHAQLPSSSASGFQDLHQSRDYFGQHAFGTPVNPEAATGNFYASAHQSSTPVYQQPNGWQPSMSPYGSSMCKIKSEAEQARFVTVTIGCSTPHPPPHD